MPHLVVQGVRYLISSDEVFFFLVFGVCLRLLWTAMLLTTAVSVGRRIRGCPDAWLVWVYLTLSLLCFGVAAMIQAFGAQQSLKGTMVQPERRQYVGQALYRVAQMLGLQLALSLFGVYLVSGAAPVCGEELRDALDSSDIEGVAARDLVILGVVTQMLDLAVFAVCGWILRRGGRRQGSFGESFRATMLEQEMEERCRRVFRMTEVLTCRLFGGGGDGDFRMAGRLLAALFSHDGRLDLDIVPSDVVAGLVLVRHQQRAKEERLQRSLSSQDDAASPAGAPRAALPLHNRAYRVAGKRLLSRRSAPDREALEELSRYADYALAPYTWMLAVYQNPWTNLWRIARRRLCGLPRRCPPAAAAALLGAGLPSPEDAADAPLLRPRTADPSLEQMPLDGAAEALRAGVVEGDNWLRAHEAALLCAAGARSCDLLYASFRNGVGQCPYALLKEPARRTLVLCIRGTLSLEDLVIDAAAEPSALDAAGERCGFDGAGRFAHSGILQAAEWIVADLERHGVLNAFLQRNPHYRLKVVGHSLGGGSAALVGLMLRGRHPEVRVLSYSPPGQLLSRGLAAEMEPFCLSAVLGADIVPRLSAGALTKLRNQVLDAISRARVSKVRIMRSVLDGGSAEAAAGEMLWEEGAAPDSAFLRQLQAYQGMLAEQGEAALSFREEDAAALRRVDGGSEPMPAIASFLEAGPMGLPGRIVHLVKTEDAARVRCLGLAVLNQRRYTPVHAEPEDFDSVIISPSMGIDHFPNRIVAEIHRVAEAWGLEDGRAG